MRCLGLTLYDKNKNALLALTSGLYYIIFMNVIYDHKLSFSLERELE